MTYPTVTSHAIISGNGSGNSTILQTVLKRTMYSCPTHAARFFESVLCKCSFLQNFYIMSGLFHIYIYIYIHIHTFTYREEWDGWGMWHVWGRGGMYRVLVGKPEGKRPLGRPRRRWEDNIKMDLHEVGGGCGDWMELAQDTDRWRALVSTVMNLRVQKIARGFLD